MTIVSATLRSSEGAHAQVADLVVPPGVSVHQPLRVADAAGVTWELIVHWTNLPSDSYAALDSAGDRFADFTTVDLADELARRLRDRAEIDAEYDDWPHPE